MWHLIIKYWFREISVSSMTTCVVHWIEKVICAESVLMASVPQWPHLDTSVNCTDAWYRVPLFLFLEFVPVTIFYLVILVFQISITSAPLPCFIMYVQFIVIALDSNVSLQTFLNNNLDFRLDMKIVLSLYGLFNLDFFRYSILPPYCISSAIKPIYLASLGYISVFYPIIIIFLTWLCVKLHGRNCRPLVWLWRPFHRYSVQLQRGWDTEWHRWCVHYILFFVI